MNTNYLNGYRGLIGGLCIVAGAAGCSNTPGNTGTTGNNQSAVLVGKMDNSAQTSAGASGAITVTASRVGSNGSLTLVSTSGAQLNSSGEYSLDINDTTTGTGQLVVEAKDSTSKVVGQAMVEGTFTAVGSYNVMPITANSTAEANVMIAAMASGQFDSTTESFGELRGMLSDQVVGNLTDSSSSQAQIQAAANVALSAMASWNQALIAQGMSAQDIQTANSAAITAEASLDAALNASSSSSDTSTAVTANLAATLKGYTDAGASIQQLALASTAMADVTASYMTTLSANAQSQAEAQIESLHATQVGAALSSEFSTMTSSSTTQQTVTSATAALQTSITGAASSGSSAQSTINTAWSTYDTAINAQLTSVLPLLTAQLAGTVQTSLQTDAQTLNTARASLSGTAAVSANATAEANALVTFSNSAMTQSTALTTLGITNAQATAWLNAALQIDSSTSGN